MRVAINGLGRIGRAVFKLLVATPELELAAVNDVIPTDNLAYLLNHDTVYGRYPNRVTVRTNSLVVADRSYPVYTEPDPSRLPWMVAAATRAGWRAGSQSWRTLPWCAATSPAA